MPLKTREALGNTVGLGLRRAAVWSSERKVGNREAGAEVGKQAGGPRLVHPPETMPPTTVQLEQASIV